MNLCIFFLIFVSSCSGFFIRYPFGQKFLIKNREITRKLDYALPLEKQKVINKINGFYGLIGPDVNINNVSTIFDLFIGDGYIQGIFFENGELTYVKKYIRTEKILYEEENGRIPESILAKVLFGILNKLKLFPNVLGLANTAILNVKSKTYALYERDSPYLIDIDFKNKEIETLKKTHVPSMNYFSAHSKWNNTIESIDYNVLLKRVQYYKLTEEFVTIKNNTIPMEYLPIVHDFISSDDSLIIIDSPLVINFSNIFKKSMPVFLDTSKKTIINVLDKKTLDINKYYINTGFYIFHYADYKETDNIIEIYASQYDKLDFSELNINGKYRKILINRETKQASIIKNNQLEEMNLEFPVKYGDKVVFRNMKNKQSVGFVVCKELEIIKCINLTNKTISGEPAIKYINNIPYLIAFAFTPLLVENVQKRNNEKNNSGFLIIIDMNTYEVIEIPINETIGIGFHATFISSTV